MKSNVPYVVYRTNRRMAYLEYAKGNYEECREHLKDMMETYSKSPEQVRRGLRNGS